MGDLGTFATELRDALASLYDPLYQPDASLYERLGIVPERGAAAVQAVVLEAVHALEPDPSVPEDAQCRRLYDVLRTRYIEGLTQEASAQKLRVSARYLRRLQAKAVSLVAQRLLQPPSDSDRPSQAANAWSSQVERELLSLQKSAPDVTADIASSVDAVLRLARALPERRALHIERGLIMPNTTVAMHPAALRQILLRAVEELTRDMPQREATIGAQYAAGRVTIDISARGESDASELDLELVQKIVSAHGGTVITGVGNGRRTIELLLPVPGFADRVAVLVVDDNDDLVTFYKAYVTGTAYDITQTRSAAEAMAMIEKSPPDMMVLDVMLPDREMDGWGLLIHLRQQPETMDIPVIICSVIRDAELAQALGAAGFLPKPVRRAEFIQGLDQAMASLIATDAAAGS